jgi:hypothetical protein
MQSAKFLRYFTRRLDMNMDQATTWTWTRILAHLDMSELKAARLICSTSRRASVPYVKFLAFKLCPESEDMVKRCRGVFPFVTSIVLSIQLPQHAAQANLIGLPAVRSRLCKLTLSLSVTAPTAAWEENCNLDDMITNVKLAAHLTSLELCTFGRSGCYGYELPASHRHQLLSVLGACGALRELTLGVDFNGLMEAVLGLTSLRTLHGSSQIGLFPLAKLLEIPTRVMHRSCLDKMSIADHALLEKDGFDITWADVDVNDIANSPSSRVARHIVQQHRVTLALPSLNSRRWKCWG